MGGVVLGLDSLGVLVAIVLGALAALVVRRKLLQRPGGTFDCSLRLQVRSHGKGWMLGLGRYAGDELEWYRVFSYSPRPKRVFARRELEVMGRRKPEGPESFSLLSGSVVVPCSVGSGAVEFGMSEEALTGFLSWLEAAPPGQHLAG